MKDSRWYKYSLTTADMVFLILTGVVMVRRLFLWAGIYWWFVSELPPISVGAQLFYISIIGSLAIWCVLQFGYMWLKEKSGGIAATLINLAKYGVWSYLLWQLMVNVP